MIGALLFPFGAYFPGFTLSSILSAIVYSLFLYQKDGNKFSTKSFIIRLSLSSFIVLFFIFGGLNTLWLYVIQNNAVLVSILPRMIKQLVMLPIQVITIFGLYKLIAPVVYEGEQNDRVN